MMHLPQGVHIVTTKREYKGKTYCAHLLRHSFREDGKVKNETLANLTPLGDDLVALLRAALRGEPVGVVGERFEVIQSWHHGHVQTVLLAMQRLEMAGLLASRPCTERTLVLAMIAARILAPASKLATSRWFDDTTLLLEFGRDHVDEDQLYHAMDWLLEQQKRIEDRLAARHLELGGMVLYDLSSTYFEGKCCPLAARGHNRDGKTGKLQANFGLVTDPVGRPVSVDVVRGNVGDPKTVMAQVDKVVDRFKIGQFVLIGDRGMITQKHIDAMRGQHPGVQWVTALRSASIRKLVESGALQFGLFDERNLFEFEYDDYPGERLVACRNPDLAKLRKATRLSLLTATEVELAKVAKRVASGRLKGAEKIGVAVGRVVNKYKVAKHFELVIDDGALSWTRDQNAIDAEAALDGIYVVRTSVPASSRSADDTVRDYKRLTQVEHAFRSMKTVDLHVRPVWHRDEGRVKAHIFLCMLAYYVQWHLEHTLAELTFGDEQPELRRQRDPVAPAVPSPAVKAKAATKYNADDVRVHRLTGVLQGMATIVRNRCRWAGNAEAPTFDVVTTPSAVQRRVLELVGRMEVSSRR